MTGVPGNKDHHLLSADKRLEDTDWGLLNPPLKQWQI